MDNHHETMTRLLTAGTPFVAVTIVEASGSIPAEAGAKMLVTNAGLAHGTVGGGKVETRAIAEAQSLLRTGSRSAPTRFVRWSLSKDVGMTCGGSLSLYFEAHNLAAWTIAVFGAGHVAQAVVEVLARLECRILCFDPRPEWLERIPRADNVCAILAPDMPSQVAALPDDAFVALMTMGHTTDKPILLEILRTRAFPYVGVIGSRAKAIQLRQDVAEAGLPETRRHAFHCPIGLDLGSNAPQEIAISVAAQMLLERYKGGAVP